MRLVVRHEAEADIASAFAWYETQQVGAGQRFVVEISRCLAAIEEQPLRFPRVRGSARRALLRRFPYALFFVVEAESVSIIAAMHMAREPSAWLPRADDRAD